ncbi:MAG TPA: hypothetical protein VGG28_28960 [Kofleriaceae bacterium]|jgi:hypothetical protein
MRKLGLLVLVACGSPAPSHDASPDAYDGAAACATSFGSALTDSFGRLDGTLLAIVPPGDDDCAQPNSTHVVVQVTAGGAAYRMVVNVVSEQGDPDVIVDDLDAALAGPAWSEGWHTDAPLDYVTTLGVTMAQFTSTTEAHAVARIEQALTIGAHISVYATSSGGSDAASAHLVHRNATDADGAIVLNPETAPHYLLSAFADQTF